MVQLGSHFTDVYEIQHLNIYLKSDEKFQVLLTHDKNDAYFT